MRLLSIVTVSVICIFYSACHEKEAAIDRIVKVLANKTGDSSSRIMSEYYKEGSISLELFRRRVSSLHLPSLTEGKEGFQLRVWDDKFNNTGLVIILDYSGDQWSAKGFRYKAYSSDGNWPDSLAGPEISLGQPLSGWDNFMNTLLDYKILELRDYTEIPGYFESTDMTGPSVEIAGHKYFRYYELPEPKYQSGKIDDAKSMLKILEIIKKEFPGWQIQFPSLPSKIN